MLLKRVFKTGPQKVTVTFWSYEDPELGHGFFTDSVMKAIRGAPLATAQGNVSVLSMKGFVITDVPRRVLAKYGRQQHPSAYSLGFYDFPISVIK